MTTRHEYFRKRLTDLGLFDQDSDYNGMIGRAVDKMSEVFAAEGHSGTSAVLTLQLFNQLMEEWNTQNLQ